MSTSGLTAHTQAARTSPTSPPQPDEDLSFLRLANVLLRQRWLVARCALLVFALVVGVTLALPRSYTARSSFMPQTRKATSAISGLAAQFGLAVPTTEGAQSPAFYADLVKSRGILGGVVDTPFEYTTARGPVTGSLTDYYEVEGSTPALRRDEAIRELTGDVAVTTVQKTGVVHVDVTMREPGLAHRVNQRLLELVNEFNLRTRQSQAGEERRFTERRLAEVRQDLRAAEDRLQQFMQRNRDMRNSPELTLQADRLERDVLMQQQLYTSLAEAYEQAKIEEVRDTPVITIVQAPETPVRPDRRGLLSKGIAGLLVGLLVGAALAFWRAYAANSASSQDHEAAEFARLRRQTAGELRRPWRPLALILGLGRSSRSDG